MPASVRFYRDLLGLEIIYGGEDAYFSSLRTKHGKGPILNLESGNSVAQWGRLIIYVSDIDEYWKYQKEHGQTPPRPQDASCAERYFHPSDPDGHELSSASTI